MLEYSWIYYFSTVKSTNISFLPLDALRIGMCQLPLNIVILKFKRAGPTQKQESWKLCIAHVTDHSPRQPAFISWFKAVLPHLPPVMGSATEDYAALVSSCMYTTINHWRLVSPDCESNCLCQWLNWYDISLNFQD